MSIRGVMNEKLTTIATKYAVEFDQIPSILDGLNIENPDHLEPKHIEQFETACLHLKDGQDFDEAIALSSRPQPYIPQLTIQADTIILDDEDDDDPLVPTDAEHDNNSEREETPTPTPTPTHTPATINIDFSKTELGGNISSPDLQFDLNGLVSSDILNKHLEAFSHQITSAILNDLVTLTQVERQRIANLILEKVRKNLITIVQTDQFKQQFQEAITKNVMPKDVVSGHEYEFHVAQQLVIQQLIVFVQENERAIKVREDTKRLKIEEIEHKLKERRVMHQEISFWLGSGISVSLILMIGLFLGVMFGVNVPDGAACTQRNFLCQWFRFRQPLVEFEVRQKSYLLSTTMNPCWGTWIALGTNSLGNCGK